ncbi:MAG: energy transducer TonB [Deltaproteobacteria bacterium]|nr:energy transducer TonB [Deltaproteobacteria bacterium]
MKSGAIVALIGSLIALLGGNVGAGGGATPSLWRQWFSAAHSEELGYRGVALLQTWPGQISAVLALIAVAAAVLVLRQRRQRAGWLLVGAGVAQLGLAWLTWQTIYAVVPCESLGLAVCNADGGLLPMTYLHLNGLVWLALGGALGALGGAGVLAAWAEYPADRRFLRVALHWGEQVVAERVLFVAQPVTVGEAAGNLLQVPAGGLASHTLFSPLAGDAYQLVLPYGARAELQRSGQPVDFDGVAQVDDGCRGAVSFDNGLELHFDFTAAQQGALAGGPQRRDQALALSFALVFSAAVVAFVALATLVPLSDPWQDREALAQKNRGLIEVALQEPEPPAPLPLDTPNLPPREAKADGEEGKVGDPQEDPAKVTKVPKSEAPLRRPDDARHIGVAEALSAPAALPGALGTIMAGDTSAIRDKMAVPMDGNGDEIEFGHGTNGLGMRNTGNGGGGDQPLVRITGSQDGPGRDGWDPRAQVALRKKPKIAAPHFKLAEPQPTAGCDPGDISKNVRSRSNAIRSCYETQLLAHSDLAGKVTLQWTVAGDGRVSGEKTVDDTLGNATVTDCVLRAVRRIQFAPPAAGVCVVRWPVVFRPD